VTDFRKYHKLLCTYVEETGVKFVDTFNIENVRVLILEDNCMYSKIIIIIKIEADGHVLEQQNDLFNLFHQAFMQN